MTTQEQTLQETFQLCLSDLRPSPVKNDDLDGCSYYHLKTDPNQLYVWNACDRTWKHIATKGKFNPQYLWVFDRPDLQWIWKH